MKKINIITLLLLSALLIGCNDDGSSSGAIFNDPIGDPDVVDNATMPDDNDTMADDGLIDISTLEDLYSIRDNLTGNFELMNNLDFNDVSSYASGVINTDWTTGLGWPGIGFCTAANSCTSFSGEFEGNGFTITNLFINASSTTNGVGLFRAANGTISNLRVVNASVTGGASDTGILIGYGRNSDIRHVSSDGVVESSGISVGGLIGDGVLANVNNSYAAGHVSGSQFVGGLIGDGQAATVTNSYATGHVSGSQFVGGLIGNGALANVDNSYAIGSVSGNSSVGGLIGFGTGTRVSSSYWDTDTTGQTRSAGGGTGKTTSELQSPTSATGIYEDWTDCWDFGNSTQYPVLTCTPGGIAEQR